MVTRMTSAERQAKRRRRRREDRLAIRVEVSRETRDALVEARQLAEWNEDDAEAVREAVQAHLDGLRPVTA